MPRVLVNVAFGGTYFPLSTGGATSDFSNTLNFVSLEAVDANGNMIPGVSLEAADGTIFGPDGMIAP
jgi:hypothetical protein